MKSDSVKKLPLDVSSTLERSHHQRERKRQGNRKGHHQPPDVKTATVVTCAKTQAVAIDVAGAAVLHPHVEARRVMPSQGTRISSSEKQSGSDSACLWVVGAGNIRFPRGYQRIGHEDHPHYQPHEPGSQVA